MKKILRFLILIFAILIAINHKNILKKVYVTEYKQWVYEYSKMYNIDPMLVFSIIKAESNFNSYAVSTKGAVGLMQITPSTGVDISKQLRDTNFKKDDLLNPELNIRYGCYYFRKMLDLYNGNINLALMAYNAGHGNVNKWIEKKGINITIEEIPFYETRNYVKKINKYYKIYKYLYSDVDS